MWPWLLITLSSGAAIDVPHMLFLRQIRVTAAADLAGVTVKASGDMTQITVVPNG